MSAKLAKYIGALTTGLVLCSTALGEDKNGATISVYADEHGTASVSYSIWVDKPLAPEQVRALESAIGAALDDPAQYDDSDDDDDRDAAKAPHDSARTFMVYTAQPRVSLRRSGFRFEGDLDLVGVAAALKKCGIQEARIVMCLPKKVDPGAAASLRSSPRAIRDSVYAFHSLDLAGSATPGMVLHIAFGEPGPSAGWRLTTLLALLISIVGLVICFQRLALREVERGTTGSSLAHTRFSNLMSLVLPVSWWMAFSITGFRDLAFHRFGFGPIIELVLAEGLIGLGLPCLTFWVCALIWRPVWRAVPLPVNRPGRMSQSPHELFLGSFSPMLLILGGLFYFFEGRPDVGAIFVIAAPIAIVLRLKLSVKLPGLQMHVLLAPELRERIFELASRAKVKLAEVFVLAASGHRLSNACAAANNTVWISEYLLRRLSRAEVDAIVAHELGHLKRRHPTLRMAAASGGLAAGLMAALFLREMGITEQHLNLLFPTSLALSFCLLFFLARRQEYSADWWSVGINGDAEAMITGLVRITRDGQLPLNWSKWDEKLLSHPSTLRRARRIAARSGITKERLDELLNVPAGPGECYSLAAGSSGIPTLASGVAPPAEARRRLKHRTGYSAAPPVFGLLAFYAMFLLTLIGPEWISNKNLLASPAQPYCLAAAAIFGVLVCVLASRSQKRKQARGLTRPFTFSDASPAQFPGLDLFSMNACTADLESLGFVVAGDHSAETAGARDSLQQFIRVFVSPEHKCWARLTQVMTATLGVTKVECSFASTLGQGYAVYTSNAEPSAALYAGRLPREIRVHAPGVAPADLLSIHIARLERAAAAAGLAPLAVESGDAYLAHELDRAAERRQVIKRRNAWLFLLRIDRFSHKPKLEWAGEDKRINSGGTGRGRPTEPETQSA